MNHTTRRGDLLPGVESKAPKRNARDMLTMLARHYEPPPSKPHGGRLVEEIQAPNSTRRADALYLPITNAGRGTIIGHEIKVDRSDVIAELRDPHKADSWLRYCSRWWLVISDPSLIDGLDVPPEWGVLAPPSRANTRFMTVLQKAPALHPDPAILHQAWGTIFAKVAYADIAEMRALERSMSAEKDWRKRYEDAAAEVTRLNRALGEEVGDLRGHRGRAVKVADILADVERLGGYGDDAPKGLRGMSWDVDSEQVARGILALAAVEGKGDSVQKAVQAALNQAERTTEELRGVLAALEVSGGE